MGFACGRDATVEDTGCLANGTDRIALFATRLPVGSCCTGSQDGKNPTEPCVEGACRVDPGKTRTIAH